MCPSELCHPFESQGQLSHTNALTALQSVPRREGSLVQTQVLEVEEMCKKEGEVLCTHPNCFLKQRGTR